MRERRTCDSSTVSRTRARTPWRPERRASWATRSSRCLCSSLSWMCSGSSGRGRRTRWPLGSLNSWRFLTSPSPSRLRRRSRPKRARSARPVARALGPRRSANPRPTSCSPRQCARMSSPRTLTSLLERLVRKSAGAGRRFPTKRRHHTLPWTRTKKMKRNETRSPCEAPVVACGRGEWGGVRRTGMCSVLLSHRLLCLPRDRLDGVAAAVCAPRSEELPHHTARSSCSACAQTYPPHNSTAAPLPPRRPLAFHAHPNPTPSSPAERCAGGQS
mmetsp:Transcript_20643/g.60337  ORF Transcript_20643/g.60337 Transcript_20643/m.60337 type:complete len:273 (+) Transcript_20643:214-1032(+)